MWIVLRVLRRASFVTLVLLLPFGFWLWPYAVPALAILVWLARRDRGRRVR